MIGLTRRKYFVQTMAANIQNLSVKVGIKYTDNQLKAIRSEAVAAQRRCDVRGLVYTAKWLSELALALETHLDAYPDIADPVECKIPADERTKHAVALNYYRLGEYQRAQNLIKDCQSGPVKFLHFYCRFLAGENKSGQPNQLDGECKDGDPENQAELCNDLSALYKDNKLDAYLLYLYGIVLKKCGYAEDSQTMFLKSIHSDPSFWGAWYELTSLINERNDLTSLNLPDHWMKHFFLAHAYLGLQLSDYAAEIYMSLLENGFKESSYVIAQLAVAYDNMKDVDMSIRQFEILKEKDPYRLDDMDIFSNALYVKDMRVELADLASRCIALDKYRAETCCVIGNYYSLREQHEHAVMYFKRALKLDPNFISAWTLMGHEYMEMNNQNAAIQSYRKALDVDSRDFRAWYGLGQTHEFLKMHHYSLYYFQQALKLRPNDSRMLMAVGLAFKLLNRPQEAKICFWKAHMLGDPEGIALTHLAKLHESLKEDDNAAAAFTKFVLDATQSDLVNPKEIAHAYRFLANYNLKVENYEEAYIAAQKCAEFPETREEGKALLKQITQTRGIPDEMGDSLERLPQEANDSLTHELYRRVDATPAPHLSPINLRFQTPDH